MDEHIRIGHKYPSVRLNTTYSFGLDDQEFVVAFETDIAKDFLDLVMELRNTEGSLFTLRDTPIYTCVAASPEQIVCQLGSWGSRGRFFVTIKHVILSGAPYLRESTTQ